MIETPRRVTDPTELAVLYGRHPDVHPYGLADLEEPLWSRSRWYRAGDAVVGVLDLGSGEPVLYAVAADDAGDRATLDLLAALAPDLPDHFVITGPLGLADRLAPAFAADWVIPHVKMRLPDARALPPPDPRVTWLTTGRGRRGHRPARRPAVTPAPSSSRPCSTPASTAPSGPTTGPWSPSPASMCSPQQYGVAAVGNVLTHPDHRRTGLAQALMATLARRLLAIVPVVGLNVGTANHGARALYDGLGFLPVVTYEEAELRRVH